MAEYAINIVEKFPTEGVEKVLKETSSKNEAQRNLIEKVFDVKFDNNGELTPESVNRIEGWSLHDSLQRASDCFEQIADIDISNTYQEVLIRINKIENFVNRTSIYDGKFQNRGNKLFHTDKDVKWLGELVEKTRSKVDQGIALITQISFIIADARTLLNETLKFGQNKKALEEFCHNIDEHLPDKLNNLPEMKNTNRNKKSEFDGLINLLSAKFEGLGKIGSVIMSVLCGIGMVFVSAAVVMSAIASILVGITLIFTAGIGCVVCTVVLGYHRKAKLNSLVKGLESIQGNLEKVNKDLESGLQTLRTENDGGTGFSILFQAFSDFKHKIGILESNPKYSCFHPDRIIEHIREADSDMSVLTGQIQQRFNTDQPNAWGILMFIHGCDKLQSEGKLDWN